MGDRNASEGAKMERTRTIEDFILRMVMVLLSIMHDFYVERCEDRNRR